MSQVKMWITSVFIGVVYLCLKPTAISTAETVPVCNVPHLPENGEFKTMSCRTVGCNATISCKAGFKYTGTKTIFCQQNLTWTGVPGECEGIVCPKLPDSKNGKIRQMNRTYLSNATMVCNEGYFLSPPDSGSIQCQDDGTWSNGMGTCEAVQCSPLSAPIHGRIDQRNFTYLAKATVVCDKGYVYSEPGSIVKECQSNNTWSGEEGVCDAAPCPDLPAVENGILTKRSGRFGDKVILQCPSGHTLDGPSSVTCQADGTWSTVLGTCSKLLNQVALGGILSAAFVPTLILAVFGLFWYRHHKSVRQLKDEEMPLLDKCELHCSFKLREDFSDEFSRRDSNEYLLFSSVIREQIIDALKHYLNCTTEVTIIDINQAQKTIFIDVRLNVHMSQSDLSRTLKNLVIKAGKDFHVDPDSFVFRESIKNILAADIMRKRHAPDKGLDRVIDLDTQYVRLKLLSNKTLSNMHGDKLERPDLYQHGLEKEDGVEIQDEDLLKGDQPQKYILIRGRAGIGKSTLLQSILWKWANGNIAVSFKAIFMLNLRYLITVQKKMNLPSLLCLYAVYGMHTVNVDKKWLKNNQDCIGIVLDGIDEIQSFKDYWDTADKSRDKMMPIEWCLAIMRRAVLPRSTFIVSSRPFADLQLLENQIRSSKLSKHLHLVELMGLTRRRVFEFVETNVPEERKEFVKETLIKNPILLSVCAITFYCAALCQVLGHGDMAALQLSTYTRITAYILKEYMQRSLIDDSETSEDVLSDSAKHTLHLLSRLALAGLLGEKPRELPRLVFEKKDFENLNITKEEVHKMRRSGLLTETEIQDPDDKKKSVTLSQFVHLSIQEFLAMAGLLQEDNRKVNQALAQMSESGQFNMTLLFLYGLFFDKDSIALNNVMGSMAFKDGSSLEKDLLNTLLSRVGCVTNDLQALQIAHESQSQEIADKVGERRFKERVDIYGTKLTVIDITAMVQVLKHYKSAHTIRLQHVGLDVSSVQEISSFLQDCDTIQTLDLNEDTLDYTCIKHLAQCLEKNNSLATLSLASEEMDDRSVAEVADVLCNTHLKKLSLTSDKITDAGIRHLGFALKENKTLESLSITSEGVMDVAMKDLVTAVKGNNKLLSLTLDCNAVTDQGMATFAEALVHDCKLQYISLAFYNVTDAGLWQLGFVLKENKTLECLSILSGGLTDDGVQNIASALTDNESLVDLRLYGFRIHDKGVDTILKLVTEKGGLAVRIWPPDCSDVLEDQLKSHPRILAGYEVY